MRYKVVLKTGTIEIDDAMNYEHKNGFFNFFTNFDSPIMGKKQINFASLPEKDVEQIIYINDNDKTKDLEKEWKMVLDLSKLKTENNEPYFQIEWLIKKIMKLTDDEIEENKKK